jgi:hypothetical protein
MIMIKELRTLEDFLNVKKGDFLAVEWKLDSYIGNKRTRFAVYEVYDVHHDHNGEIILQKKNNVYFNYKLILGITEGCSQAKTVCIITSDPDSKSDRNCCGLEGIDVSKLI